MLPNQKSLKSLIVILIIGISLCSHHSFGQCSKIQLSVSEKEACSPALLKFKVLNAPKGSGYNWNLGSGVVSGPDSANKIYDKEGWVNINVEVLLIGGKTCKISGNNISYIRKSPQPKVKVSKEVLCFVPDTLTLFDQTPRIKKRVWVIDGQSIYSNRSKSSVKIQSSGLKSVVLVAEDSFGCRGVRNFPDIIDAHKDLALSISSEDTSGCVEKDIQFGSNLSFYKNNIKEVKWSFPSGFPSSSDQITPPKIYYSKSGSYDVKLEMTTKNGCTQKLVKKSFVQLKDTSIIHLIHDSFACIPHKLKLQIPDSMLKGQFEWNFFDSYSENQIEHVTDYTKYITLFKDGYHPTQITYKDGTCISRLQKDSAILAVKVTPSYISHDHYDCELPFKVHFKNKSRASLPGELKYTWGFFDSTQMMRPLSHIADDTITIHNSGYYSVGLKVEHLATGCSDYWFRENYIRADSIIINPSPSLSVACINQPVQIFNHSYASTYRSKDRFKWYLYESKSGVLLDSVFDHEPRFTLNKEGFYDLKVTASNHLGCKGFLDYDSAFQIAQPELGFFATPPNACKGDTIILADSSKPTKAQFTNRWRISSTNNTYTFYDDLVYLDQLPPGIYDVAMNSNIKGYCNDSMQKKAYLKVSGIDGEINLNTYKYCRSSPIQYSVNIIDQNNLTNNKKWTYEWTSIPSSGLVIDDSTKSKPLIQFTNQGNYVLKLVLTNAVGCTDTVYSDTIKVGLNPKFEYFDSTACANAPIGFKNQSSSLANRFYSQISPSVPLVFSQINKDSFTIAIDKKGTYSLALVASKDSVCFDTAYVPIEIVSPQVDFEIADTNLHCVPAFQQFEVKGNFADTFFWDFGNGVNLKTTYWKVTTAYQQASKKSDPFDIRLIAKHKSGCTDTVFKKDLFGVSGPYANFTFENAKGCEPLEVTVKGETENVSSIFYDFDDGSTFGSNISNKHTYYNYFRINEQSYKPQVMVVDSKGCQVLIKADSVITVKPSPKMKIATNDTIGCAPYDAEFYSISQGVNKLYWDFDDDGVNDRISLKGNWTFADSGQYPVRLIGVNDFNCSDTATQKIEVIKLNKPRIKVDGPLCANGVLSFADISEKNKYSTERNWKLIFENDQFESKDSSFQRTMGGNSKVTVSLSHSINLGCKSSTLKQVFLIDSIKLKDSELKKVDYDDLGFVEVQLKNKTDASTRWWFEIKERNTAWSALIDTPSGSFSEFKSAVNYRTPVCVRYRKQDYCKNYGAFSKTHCTIFLNVSSVLHAKNYLSWTPYIGWDSISKYRIHKWNKDGEYSYTDVPSSQTNYIHSGLCNEMYRYRITAFSANDNLTSKSNYAEAKPDWKPSVSSIHIRNVSVEGEGIRIRAKAPTEKGTKLLLNRSKDAINWDLIPIKYFSYKDSDVDVSEGPYYYKASYTDRCGYTYTKGNTAKTIYLEGSLKDNLVTLNWNAYKVWPVAKYEVYFRDDINPINSVVGYKNSITFENTTKDYGGILCYKIKAVHHQELFESYSNTACVFGKANMYIPSAFSPNGDGLNDVFLPKYQFLLNPADDQGSEFHMRIFTRWGEKIFETNDIRNGWDGNYLNKEMPEGVYLYSINSIGADGQKINKRGTISLIKGKKK